MQRQVPLNQARRLFRLRNQLPNDKRQDRQGHYDFSVDLATNQPQERNNEGSYDLQSCEEEFWSLLEEDETDQGRYSSQLHEPLLNEFSSAGSENVPQRASGLAARRVNEAAAMQTAAAYATTNNRATRYGPSAGVNLPGVVNGSLSAEERLRIKNLSTVLIIMTGMQPSDLRTVEQRLSELLNQGDQGTHDRGGSLFTWFANYITSTFQTYYRLACRILEYIGFVLRGITAEVNPNDNHLL